MWIRQEFWTYTIEKKVTSSTITTSAVNIAQVIWGGTIIEDIIVRTDSTGLAGWTNFTLSADWIVFFSTAVSWLGASSILDLNSASVTWIKALIESWVKNISVANTVAVWTGAWVITIELVCRRLDENSTGNAI